VAEKLQALLEGTLVNRGFGFDVNRMMRQAQKMQAEMKRVQE